MRSVSSVGVALLLLAAAAVTPAASSELRLTLLRSDQATQQTLRRIRRAGATGVVLTLARGSDTRSAALRARDAGLERYYWIEVGRCAELADAHSEWMASLQGHPEWRRRFPRLRRAAEGEVVKNYPWVPIRYREAFDAHLERVRTLLAGLPPAKGVFLNNLQAAPSACGCGNHFCRWTPDYGPLRTAAELPEDAAAKFIVAVRGVAPRSEIIPVWVTECEEGDRATACAGVACFAGACWEDYTEQLMPVAREAPLIGALATYRALGRTGSHYGPEAGWVRYALASFAEMPPKRKGLAIPASRLVAVLQGWDVTSEQRDAQVARAREAGAQGWVMAETPIEQGWEPRIMRLPVLHKE